MTVISKSPPLQSTRVPPLQSGDRLTRDEFERRYAAALLRGDMVTVARLAQQGLESPEHAAFVQKLKGSSELGPRK